MMRRAKLDWCFYGLLAAVAVILAVGLAWSWSYTVAVNTEVCQHLTEDWTYTLADGESGDITLPARLKAEANSTVRLSRVLTEKDLALGTTLRLRSSQQALRVFLDGQEIYRFGQERPFAFLHSPGCSYHFIRLDEQAAGRVLTLELSSAYGEYAGYLNEVAAGTKMALFFEILSREWYKAAICAVIAVIGLLLIASYLFFRFKGLEMTKGALYLGIAVIFIALWALTETRILEFFLPNPTVVYLLTFLSLLLIPYPMLLFLRANYPGLAQKSYDRLSLLLIAIVVVSLILQLTGTADLMETLPLSHFAVALICMVFGVVLYRECRLKRRLTLLAKGLIVLVVCVAIDMVRFYGGYVSLDSAAAMRVGMLLFTAILGYDAIGRMYVFMEQAMEAKALERLAYVDALTSCSNRTAFEQVMEELAKQAEQHAAVELVMFDVNDFKHFNDQYGHRAGDQVLATVVDCLQRAFDPCGTCYRIGGDEFIIIAMEGIDHFAERLAHLEELLHQEGGSYHIHLSCGRSGFLLDQTQNIWDIYRLADERMYTNKEQAKLKTARIEN